MKQEVPKILLVDDDFDIVDLLVYNLTKEGYDVLGVTDPLEVQDNINRFQPTIVVMDIMMPIMNGFQLCSAIRNSEYGKDLTIFFMTTGQQELHKPALQSGADDFIQKFSGLRTLIDRINLVVKRKLVIRKRINSIIIGKWELNRENQSLFSQNKKLALSEMEFDLLFFLAQNAKRSIPIKVLKSIVNGVEFFHNRQSISQSLFALAKKVDGGLIDLSHENKIRLKV
jgi:two-component system, OmpR family, alkaline phosphatase synthesis response regulator PhoP